MRTLTQPALAMAAVLAATTSWAAPSSDGYSSEGFEPPRFTAGSLDGQDGWRVVDVGGSKDDAVVTADDAHEGKQSIALRNVGRRVTVRRMQVHRQPFYVDAYLKLPAPEAVKSNATLRLRGRDRAGKGAILVDVSFNAGGSVNGVPAGPRNRYTPGVWTRITLKVDPSRSTWDLYINGEPAGTDLPARDDALIAQIDTFDLDWTSKPDAAGPGFLADDFAITTSDPLTTKASQ